MYNRYTLESYILGENNSLAYRSVEQTVINLGAKNNPLTLHGASGSGKTHLAHAWLKHVVKEGMTAIHLSAFEFIDQLIFALSNQTEDEFRNDLVECDLLIIDDLQHFGGRFGCQDVLCVILDNRIANGKLAIFTSSDHPKDLDWHNKQLESRLLSGLNIELALADTSMQTQMLEQILATAGIEISQDILAEAVKHTNGNGWLIEGVAKHITEMSNQGKDITKEAVSNLVSL